MKVVLHEIGHGIGFLSLVSGSSGEKFNALDDIFMVYLENHATGKTYPNMTNAERLAASKSTGNLHWTGSSVVAKSVNYTAGVHATGHVQMYAPNPYQSGSSVSHFDTALSPNELMEPLFTSDSTWDLTLELLKDIGWSLSTTTLPTVTVTAKDATATEAGPTTGRFTVTRTGATTAALTVNFAVTGTATSGSDYTGIGTSVTIPAGLASLPITVTPIDDAAVESDETVIVTLIADAAYTAGNPSSATVTIASDDGTSSYVLWTRSDTGQAGLWKVILETGSRISGVWVPSAAGLGKPWEAMSYAHVDAATGYVLWTRSDTGQAALWKINPETGSVASGVWVPSAAGVGGPWQASSFVSTGAGNLDVATAGTDQPISDVTVRKTGSGAGTVEAGMVRCGPDCDMLMLQSATVPGSVAEVPEAGSRFAGWETTAGQAIDILSVLPGESVFAVFELE